MEKRSRWFLNFFLIGSLFFIFFSFTPVFGQEVKIAIIDQLNSILEHPEGTFSQDVVVAVLFKAADGGYWNEVIKILDYYFDIDINQQNEDGKTLLMIAAWQKNHEAVRKLIECEVDTNIFDVQGKNAFHYASIYYKSSDGSFLPTDAEILQMLLKAGADITSNLQNPEASFSWALEKRDKVKIKGLLQKGFSIEIKNIHELVVLLNLVNELNHCFESENYIKFPANTTISELEQAVILNDRDKVIQLSEELSGWYMGSCTPQKAQVLALAFLSGNKEILKYLYDLWGVSDDFYVFHKAILSILDWICFYQNQEELNLSHQYNQNILWGKKIIF